MRLVCPNCAAQYNVDDRVIPPGGRDVQCSNCGHTWFQTAAETEPRPRVRPVGAPPAVPEPAPAQDAARASVHAATPSATASPATRPAPPPPAAAPAAAAPAGPRPFEGLVEDDDWEDDEPADHLPSAAGTPLAPAPQRAPADSGQVQGRRVLDEAVLAILREEADRESRARRAEVQGVETQGELGLTAPAPMPAAPAAPTAAPAAGAPAEPAAASAAEPPRPKPREGLPDVDQITSTLAARDDREAGRGAAPPARRAGFRLGFVVMLLAAALALAVYLRAEPLAVALPQAAEPLAAYVAAVDALRLWLATLVEGLGAGGG